MTRHLLSLLAVLSLSVAARADEQIERMDTYAHALGYVNLVASVTSHGRTIHPHGSSMHPHEWLGVTTQDYAGTQPGERVECIGADGVVMCHRCEGWQDGVMIVSGDTWPMRTDFIPACRYLGTVVCICVWDKKQ